MSRPRTHRLLWTALVAAVVIAGVPATWSVTTSRTAPAPHSAQATGEARTQPPTVASLAEPPPVTSPPAPPAPAPAPVTPKALVAAAEAAAPDGMTLGVAVQDVHTGELVAGGDGERPFMAASLTKLVLAVDVLDRHRAEGRPLDADDLDLVGRALASSDDGAMNALWGRHDGAGGIGRLAGRLGLTASLPSGSADMWGDAEVTAADMAGLLRYVLRDMVPQDAAVIVGALSAATPVAADGFAQNYGLLHQGTSPRHYAKQAWVEYAPAGYLLHSAGVAYDARTGHAYAIALLSIQPHTSGQEARDRLSAVASAALAVLT
jgi:hypothetical protein